MKLDDTVLIYRKRWLIDTLFKPENSVRRTDIKDSQSWENRPA